MGWVWATKGCRGGAVREGDRAATPTQLGPPCSRTSWVQLSKALGTQFSRVLMEALVISLPCSPTPLREAGKRCKQPSGLTRMGPILVLSGAVSPQ